MILIKHNIAILRDILLFGRINDFFIRTLILDRKQNREFKLYNYNGINVTCSVTCNICFDMGSYDVRISLVKKQITIDGNYEKVFNEDIISNIKKFDKATTNNEKISILNELKREIKKIKEV